MGLNDVYPEKDLTFTIKLEKHLYVVYQIGSCNRDIRQKIVSNLFILISRQKLNNKTCFCLITPYLD